MLSTHTDNKKDHPENNNAVDTNHVNPFLDLLLEDQLSEQKNLNKKNEEQLAEFKNTVQKQNVEIENLKKSQQNLRLLFNIKLLANQAKKSLNTCLEKNNEILKTSTTVNVNSPGNHYIKQIPSINVEVRKVLDILEIILDCYENCYLSVPGYRLLHQFTKNFELIGIANSLNEILTLESQRNPKLIEAVTLEEKTEKLKKQQLLSNKLETQKEYERNEIKKAEQLRKQKLEFINNDKEIIAEVMKKERSLLGTFTLFGPTHQQKLDAAIALLKCLNDGEINSYDIKQLKLNCPVLDKMEELQLVLKHYL